MHIFTTAQLHRTTLLVISLIGLNGCVHQEEVHPWLNPESFATEAQLDHYLGEFRSYCLGPEEHAEQLAELQQALHEISHGIEQIADRRSRRIQVEAECPGFETPGIEEKILMGSAEWVGLPTLGTYMKARLDTGAGLSSLSATEITPFERDGENWVRFNLALIDEDSVVENIRSQPFEVRIDRYVRVVQANATERRPVVRLPMTLGPVEQTVEFTLNDRRHLAFPVLLGRRFMMDIAIIDVSQTYLHPRPEFPGGEPAEAAAQDQQDVTEILED